MTLQQRLVIAVALGSGLGAATRFGLSLVFYLPPGTGFPVATLVANVAGSLLMGLLAVLTDPDGRWPTHPEFRQFLLGGFCGGFTTFSLLSLESLLLVGQGAWSTALLYVGLTLLLCLPAVALGYRCGTILQTQKSR